jgi:predicted transposase YbfD/YdcC
LIVVRSQRTLKKTGATSTASRYYQSSISPTQLSPQQWFNLIRGHWGGVEIRNHWRRDVLMGEDGSRSRNADLLANLALVRSALLLLLSDQLHEQSLPVFRENLRSSPSRCLAIITSS